MHARVALLSSFLAGPALAAPVVPPNGAAVRPVLSPDADNAALLAAISDGDPTLTSSPAPVEQVLAAAELAEQRLSATTDLDAAGELLTLVGTAREVAYERTGAADHLCALIAAAGDVLRRPELPGTLAMEAADFRSRARATLATRHAGVACVAPVQQETPSSAPPSERRTSPASHTSAVRTTPNRSRVVIAGGVLLGVAGLVGGALAGVQIYRKQSGDELDALLDEIRDAGGKTASQAQRIDDLRTVERRTDAATVALGVSVGVLAAAGVGLAVWGSRRPGPAQRARLSPHGGPHGAGFVISGHF